MSLTPPPPKKELISRICKCHPCFFLIVAIKKTNMTLKRTLMTSSRWRAMRARSSKMTTARPLRKSWTPGSPKKEVITNFVQIIRRDVSKYQCLNLRPFSSLNENTTHSAVYGTNLTVAYWGGVTTFFVCIKYNPAECNFSYKKKINNLLLVYYGGLERISGISIHFNCGSWFVEGQQWISSRTTNRLSN